jgi:hypothetical protein
MKTKLPILIVALGAALSLGALAPTLLEDIRYELERRSGRELINRDLFADTPGAVAYFQGRADGYHSAALLDVGHPQAAAYFQGLGEAFALAAELRARAERTGTVVPGGF